MTDKLLAEWFWTDRWTGSSAFGLPQEARGVYREMLTQAWRRGAKLPNDHDTIRRYTGTTMAEWRRAWPLIGKFWRVEGSNLVNDTQQEVYADAQAKSERASQRGLRGAQARHKHSPSTAQADAQADAQAQPEHKPLSLSPSPIVVPTELLNTRARNLDVVPDEDPRLRRAGKLLERYAELFQEHRKGARYHNRMHLDFPKACELVTTWPDDARLEKLAVVVLTTDDDWISRTDRGFGVFAARATWADDKLRAWEIEHGVSA